MEKQMKAERERRAQILYAEGTKQSAILTAEGEKQSQILRAEGSAQARILEAQGQARAIQQVFDAIHRGKPTQKLLAYQYLQVLPQIARGDSNKMWIIPSELTDALKGIGGMLGRGEGGGPFSGGSDDDEGWVDPGPLKDAFDETQLEDPMQALAEARGMAGKASQEATEHAAPVKRVPPPMEPPADAVPEFEPPVAPTPPAVEPIPPVDTDEPKPPPT
jgi:uncharacterized membrane protein YqiK